MRASWLSGRGVFLNGAASCVAETRRTLLHPLETARNPQTALRALKRVIALARLTGALPIV